MSEPKRLSRGYAPASLEELEQPISGSAFQFLLRVRADCDRRETDGRIARRHLAALAVAHEMSADAQRASLAELSKAKLIHKIRDGYQDINFLEWCRPADKREVRRKQFRAASKRYRNRTTSTDDSTVESTPLEAEAEKEEEKEAKERAAASPAGASGNHHMPTQADTILLAETWKEVSGKPWGVSDIHHIEWWLDQFNRLTAAQIADTLRRIAARPHQEPISKITYFDSILREQNDAGKSPRGPGIVHEIGEPLHFVIPRGIDEPPDAEPLP
jgi:hypothetical protein